MGTDCAGMFPVSVCHPDRTPVQTKKCRLKRSLITVRYLLFGSAKHNDKLVKVGILPFPPDLNNRQNIKPINIISNLLRQLLLPRTIPSRVAITRIQAWMGEWALGD